MNFYTKFFILICLSFFMTNALTAQFYTEDFGDQTAAEANWISGGTNSGTQVWTWINDPTQIFNGQPPFASTTAANGFFQFNSDANGAVAHDVTLTSPAIDCSGQSIVIAEFQNQYGFYNQGGGSVPSLGVSTDGTNFTYYTILENVEQNDLSDAVQNVIVDITAQAALQPTVYLQFRWVGNFEYTWRIDDIALSANDPTPAHNLSLDGIGYAPNFRQPIGQADTVRFQTFIDNNGTAMQTNVVVTGEILLDGVTVFTTTTTLDALPAGFNDSLVILPETFVPLIEGEYTMRYTVAQDDMDLVPVDNTATAEFLVDTGIYSKDDGLIVGANRPADQMEPWEIGNVYYVLNDGMIATTASFSIAASTGATLNGESVSVKLYEVVEDNDLNNFTDDDVSLVGIGQYDFTTEDDFTLVSTTLEDLTTGADGIPLNADSDYLLMITLGPEVNCSNSLLEYPFQVATVLRVDDWFLGGFGNDWTAVVRLGIEEPVAVKDVELSDDNSIELFPNPVIDVLTLDINLEEVTAKSTIRIVNTTGKLLHREVLDNVQSEKIDINVAGYPAGSYLLHFSTENGVKTKKFVVVK